MERNGWVVFALTASLVAAVLLSQGYVLGAGSVDRLEALSSDDPPEAEWEHRVSPVLIYLAAALWAVGGFVVPYTWAKVRAKRLPTAPHPKTPEKDDEDEDALTQPPGFAGPRVRTRRRGLAPLLGFTVLGLALLGGGIAILVTGVLTLEQTATMDGRGFRQAVLFGRLVLYAALPATLLGACALGLAWGRWWPLGELEVIDERAEQASFARKVKWSRQQ